MSAIALMTGADDDTLAAAMHADAMIIGATAAAVVEAKQAKREAEAIAAAERAIARGDPAPWFRYVCTYLDSERYWFFARSDVEAEGMCTREFSKPEFLAPCVCVAD